MAIIAHKRTVLSRFFSKTCFGCTSSSKTYALIDEDDEGEELPILAEKQPYYDIPTPKTSAVPSTTSLTTPILTSSPRQTLHRRGILTSSNYHAPDLPSSDTPPSFPSRKSSSTTNLDIDPVNNLNLMDAANMLGAASGVVGTGYGVATYYQTRSQKKDMQKRIEDLEMGIVGGEDNAGTETESRAEPDGRDAEASNTQNDHNDQRRPLPGPDYVWTGMR